MRRLSCRPVFIPLAVGLTILPIESGSAHPLQAEPVEHPYVFSFDQFHLPEDPDEHVVHGGFLLLAELRCAACHGGHPGGFNYLRAEPGPSLHNIGSRMPEDAIWRIIRSPQHTKKGTLMPGLFTGDEGDAEDVEALTEFLASLRRSEPLTMPPGDPEHGKHLYHEVGCVACHEPANDFRPVAPPANLELEKPGLASVPIVLAEAYNHDELAHFLLHPLESRPSARMPAQLRSEQEAADVAAYLQLGEIFEPAVERKILDIPAQGIERGRQVFQERNCQACHQVDSGRIPQPCQDLTSLTTNQGCLGSERTSGIPFYNLSDLQKRALRLALERIQQSPETALPYDRLDWQMARLNCYACHDRDGKGGPEDPRAQYFSNKPLPEEAGFHPYPIPPSLDRVEERLSSQALRNALRGKPPGSDSETTVRMPDFGAHYSEGFHTLFRRN